MMRKIIIVVLVSLLAIMVVGCSSTAEGVNDERSDATGVKMPVSLQLMLGTVLLDETDHPVGAEQAAELLPYWKVLRSLSDSDSAAQAEVDAVIKSIQGAMTSDQMSAIEGMELTPADSAAVMETLGIEQNFGARFGEMGSEMQATMEAMRESGEGPPEGFGPGQGLGRGMGQRPGGGGGFGGDTGMSPEMIETAMAERGSGFDRGFGINTQMLEAIIAFLETKAQ